MSKNRFLQTQISTFCFVLASSVLTGCVPEAGVLANWETQVALDPTAISLGTGYRSGPQLHSCNPDDEAYEENDGLYLADCDATDAQGELIFGFARSFYDGDEHPAGPVDGVSLSLQSQSDTICIIPAGAVELVDDVVDACLEDRTIDGCDQYFFDTKGQQFFQIADTYTDLGDAGGPFCPNYVTGPTNERGILEFYIFIDTGPAPGGTSTITATTGWQSATLIVATEG